MLVSSHWHFQSLWVIYLKSPFPHNKHIPTWFFKEQTHCEEKKTSYHQSCTPNKAQDPSASLLFSYLLFISTENKKRVGEGVIDRRSTSYVYPCLGPQEGSLLEGLFSTEGAQFFVHPTQTILSHNPWITRIVLVNILLQMLKIIILK